MGAHAGIALKHRIGLLSIRHSGSTTVDRDCEFFENLVMIKHFYIYNECFRSVVATVRFVPLGANASRTYTVTVNSGSQTMLCTTDQNSIATHSKSADGSRCWSLLEIPLSGSEYTHVLACKCPPGDSTCKALDMWPYSTTRQYPEHVITE
jgi:hypothetical protein